MVKRYLHIAVAAVMVAATSVSAGAAMYDLTTAGSKQKINNAWFYQEDPHSTGTGVIQSFLRVQKNGVEQGYNTDYSKFEFDEKGGAFTHSLLASDVPVVNIEGSLYREFLLDINEGNNTPENLLSLDRLQIFLGSAGNLHGYSAGLGTMIYDIDAGANNWLKLDYNLNSGSGGGDMFAYIPNSLFTGPNQYVYLYCMFGEQYASHNGLDSNAGFEEWAVREGGDTPTPPPPPGVPEMGSLSLAAIGLLPLAARARRRA